MDQRFVVKQAAPEQYDRVGELMVDVYSRLEGFPGPDEQPEYYRMLRNIGELASQPETELLIAVSEDGEIAGAVVYFSDMHFYGSGGTATLETDASGFRLLAVDPRFRSMGVGKQLSLECIDRARAHRHRHLVIHTTAAMQTAWQMYQRLGFERAEDLDFLQVGFPVYGFRLELNGGNRS